MNKSDRDTRQLHVDMDHVLNDAERLLADLKGQKHTKGVVKKDVAHLKEHLQRLLTHLNDLEERCPIPPERGVSSLIEPALSQPSSQC